MCRESSIPRTTLPCTGRCCSFSSCRYALPRPAAILSTQIRDLSGFRLQLLRRAGKSVMGKRLGSSATIQLFSEIKEIRITGLCDRFLESRVPCPDGSQQWVSVPGIALWETRCCAVLRTLERERLDQRAGRNGRLLVFVLRKPPFGNHIARCIHESHEISGFAKSRWRRALAA